MIDRRGVPWSALRRWRRAALRALLAILALAVVATAAAGAVLIVLARRAWPERDGRVEVTGRSAPISVARDAQGIASIDASDERDLLFGEGYVHAQDRLWQMELGRLAAAGRLSAYFGEGSLELDRLVRVVGLRAAAARDWERLGVGERALLDAYASGVNAYIARHRHRLPVEYVILGVEPEPWTPIDTLAVSHLVSFSLSQNYALELMRARLVRKLGESAAMQLMPGAPAEGPFILTDAHAMVPSWRGLDGPPGIGLPASSIKSWLPLVAAPGRAWGSNSWVVHGSRTASGRPLLANDTHLDLSMPSPWYEIGLHAGRFDVEGFSMPGIPFVIIGHNRTIAWGITNMCADVQDLYQEHLDANASPPSYQFGSERRPLRTSRESIAVRGRAPVSVVVRATHHGPVLNDALEALAGAPPLALRWSSLDGSRFMEALENLNLAHDWASFHEALRSWDAPSLNFVYADVVGNIGYQATGRIPRRAKGHTGLLPVPGWTGDLEWQGFVPYDALPTALNPSDGFIVTANNAVAAGLPVELAGECGADPHRARRIVDLLRANAHVSVADARQMQADTYSLAARSVLPRMTAIEASEPLELSALSVLRQWDLRFEPDRAGATIFAAYYWFLVENTFRDELGSDVFGEYLPASFDHERVLASLLERKDDPWFDDVTTPRKENRDEVLRRSFRQGVSWLSKRLGGRPEEWAWGRLHRARLAHVPFGSSGIRPLEWLFNGTESPAPGGPSTVNVGSTSFSEPFVMSFGATQRIISDLSQLGGTIAMNSTGQSERLFHAHREDLVAQWRRGEYHLLRAATPSGERRARALLELVPASQATSPSPRR